VSFGPIVDGVRGSIGGVTFSRAQSSDTVRGKPRPMRPRRVSQLLNQKLMSQASHMWESVTTAERLGWTNYAATVDLTDGLGNTYHPTALQAYVWHVLMLLNTGQSVAAVQYPAMPGLPSLPVLTFLYGAPTLFLQDVVPTLAAGETLLLTLHRIDRPNNFCRTRVSVRHIYVDASAHPVPIGASYDESWPVGALARAFIYWRYQDMFGRTSILQLDKYDFTVA